jgi:hypothetical protein
MDEMSKRKRIEWGYGRVGFLAHSAAISAEIGTGRSKKAVWREFRDRLGGLGYPQFLRHVARYASPKIMASAPSPAMETLQAPTTSPTSLSLRFSLGWPSMGKRWT